MAYLRDITKTCKRCGKKATKELLNRFNTGIGFYCASCGQKELKIQQEQDKASAA